jgi:transposase InsO family protein
MKRTKQFTRKKKGEKWRTKRKTIGRRFTPAEKTKALKRIEAGKSRSEVAAQFGTTYETIRRWGKESQNDSGSPTVSQKPKPQNSKNENSATKEKQLSIYAPTDPGHGLGDHEIDEILKYKKQHPSYGPAQIRAQLKRFKKWRISIKAIAKVLVENGYELVHRGSKPKGPEPTRFEAPRRNALWQLDYGELPISGQKLYVLIILDDFSRFVVSHTLADAPTSEVAVSTLKVAIARHGKPEAVRTDRGGAFIAFTKATAFGRYLEAELIDHIVGRPYKPQGGGKVEAAIGTLKRELWDVFHFEDRQQAVHKVATFFDDYNELRAHLGIDGLTPADRFFGRADKVLAAINAISRKRQGAQALLDRPGGMIEELTTTSQVTSPVEILRLVVTDGEMELRFCGARVKLGKIMT